MQARVGKSVENAGMALSFSDIAQAARGLGLDPCIIKAVVEVESGGSGFLPDGRTKILFEGHVFWKELQRRGIDPAPLASKYPNVIYPKWDRSRYKGGAAEWERLHIAASVNKDAALCSASWGLFQIMGFNHRACGFGSVQAFVDAQGESEAKQLESFCAFMRSEGLVLFLTGLDWAGFARRYNGPGYAANQYDVKMRKAYERCKAAGV
ncbi:N-acetylmuramidase family protein [Desulfovibrio sp. OttesenSCG-928-A18]|nr:N-acetylmuramidase family protein [Desulfovibrio sp. OttesenSCG-928-A18]